MRAYELTENQTSLLDRVWLNHPVFGQETVGEYLNRHKIPVNSDGTITLYHGTPKPIQFNKLKDGSYLTNSKKDAVFFAARDRGLSSNEIEVLTLNLTPDRINPGAGITLRGDYRLEDKMRAYELNEANTGFQLFVDMDGVLVGWESGVKSFLGTTMITVHNRDFWKALHNSPEEEVREWWANLEWAPGGKELWGYVSKFDPSILSAPDMNKKYREACEKGKMEWIRKNLRPQPANIIFQRDKQKTAHKFAILIDDKTKNTVPWEAAGGVAILHETGNAKKTIKELQERFGFPKR